MVHTDPATENLATDKGTIETTPNHPFFTTDRGWVQAGSLKVGEKVRTESGGSATVVSFTVDQHPASMWDLTVDTAHSFFVGSGAVLVHNCIYDSGWAKATFDSAHDSWTYHYLEHGEEYGVTEEQYQADAFGARSSALGGAVSGQTVPVGVDELGTKYVFPDGSGLILDSNNNIVTYWYPGQ
jgi:hypothetical protein